MMTEGNSIRRPKALPIAVAMIALLGTAACDATKKSASNSSISAQNVIVPADEGQRSEGQRSGDGNEMDARAGMHNEMSGHRAAGQGMGSGMGGMKDDHMGMGSGNMANGQAPADPPMKGEM